MTVLDLPTPLSRVYGAAMQLGVSVKEANLGSVQYGAMLVCEGDHEHLGLVIVDDSLGDELRAHLLIFAMALAVMIGDGLFDAAEMASSEGNIIVIGREYQSLPNAGLGHLAALMAESLGVTARAPVFEILRGAEV